jgi:hypothetical protein
MKLPVARALCVGAQISGQGSSTMVALKNTVQIEA